jgi:uncharacterized protein YacL
MNGRIGVVNKPIFATVVAPVVGLLIGLLLHSLMKRPWSITVYYVFHFMISMVMVFLFFAIFVKDSL